MTENIQEQIEQGVTEALNPAPEPEEVEIPDDIPLERCDITFVINVHQAETLGTALDTAAVSLARYGLNAFYLLATDPDTGRQWIVHDGQVTDAEDAEAELAELRADNPL